MKKVVRMLGLCALVALAFTSCKKKETNGNVTFKATINQSASERTYMTVEGLVNWSANDKIFVFKDAADFIPCTINYGVNDRVAYFEGNADFLSEIETANSYSAFYPVNEDKSIGNTVSLTIPEEQTYVPTSFATNLYPMYATNDGNKNFTFHSDAGVLAIAVTKSTQTSSAGFDKIKVEATGLVGTMVYDFDYPITKADPFTVEDPKDAVILNCDPNVEILLGEPRHYNIVLLPGTYDITVTLYNGENKITLTSGDNNGISGESFTLDNVTITAERRVIAPIIFIE